MLINEAVYSPSSLSSVSRPGHAIVGESTWSSSIPEVTFSSDISSITDKWSTVQGERKLRPLADSNLLDEESQSAASDAGAPSGRRLTEREMAFSPQTQADRN